MRSPLSYLLNILIPGTGLIMREREWLGFLLALLFGACANVAIAGRLIAPDAIPPWLTIIAMIMGGFAWILAQALLWRQCRTPEHGSTVVDDNPLRPDNPG